MSSTVVPPAGSSPLPPPPFDLTGPLPSGTTLLEASAGTGKTYAIATLTARYVAEGFPLDRLLVITFTRAATGELRARVRERLAATRDGLDQVTGGGEAGAPGEPAADGDELVALLGAADPETVAVRRDRLARALSQFDAATIETTHGFCNRVLAELGVAGNAVSAPILVEDVDDLVTEVVDDLYVRKYARTLPVDMPMLERAEALKVAEAVTNHHSSVLVPAPDGTGLPAIRRRFADAVIREVDARKRAAGLLTYDDVLVRLRDILADPLLGDAACARLRAHYDVVLIDEFQDTDPVQWEIIQRAFGPTTTLVLIGDPKQAIYAFRGADVETYLAAARTTTARATLAVNWRSDGPLVHALDVLFGDTQLGDTDIVYRHVEPAARNQLARLSGGPADAALRIRRVPEDAVPRNSKGLRTDDARQFVADDLAGEVVALLSSPAVLEVIDQRGAPVHQEIRPGHLAVLVRTRKEAELVRKALTDRGVPVVVVATGNVFATTQARAWLRLLEALDQPTSRARAAAAACTCFVGWDARRLAMADDSELDRLHGQLHRWAATLRTRGVAALLATVEEATDLPARLLTHRDGERQLTDVHHVGELLHAEATRMHLGPAALATWLGQRIAEAAEAADGHERSEERSRRLDSDAAAVQVLTIHSSKGLEFPVVYCPFPWVIGSRRQDFPVFHDRDARHGGAIRTLDVGGEGVGFSAHQERARAEQRGEDLRLLYVALTRARHQVVCWWASATNAGGSPLGRLLFPRGTGAVGAGVAKLTGAQVTDRLDELASEAPGCISVEEAIRSTVTYRSRDDGSPDLALACLDRDLDATWRRVSYTSLTAPAHGTSDRPEDLVEDEVLSGGVLQVPGGEDHAHLRDVPAAFAQAPGGAAFGTLVHHVLEHADFAAEDLAAELRTALDGALAWRRVDVGDRGALVHGLAAAVSAPLGPALGELTLRQVARADRLDEVGFELPLVGGDHPHATLALGELGEVLGAGLRAGDPVAAYAPQLGDPAIAASLRGYLTGSLDLVVCTPQGQFAVCDYKTNRLDSGGPLTAYDYRPAALDQEMARCHYPLQALLYLVALHRYLRWRLPDYEPSLHLGGAHYLFLRGMTGDPDAWVGEHPCGVWSWQPPAAVIETVSDLLDQGRQP